MHYFVLFILACLYFLQPVRSQGNTSRNSFKVIAYYSGDEAQIEQFAVEKLTHIIYSFCHLKGNELVVDNLADSLTIKKLVALKLRHPGLKILLSLGGWGGCAPCSDIFSTAEDRAAFAHSVLRLSTYFHTDGIDLDWEYPAIEGYPGHHFQPEDKAHFTALVGILRKTLGPNLELSFAAGGFRQYLEHSIDWAQVMPLVNYVNIMSYDLVNGNTPHTGHHTPLFATEKQKESARDAVNFLDSLGVPKQKMVIGAAFYARTWEHVAPVQHGLHQPGKFKDFIAFRNFEQKINRSAGFIFYYDSIARAPYAYNPTEKIFASFDDKNSVAEKTSFALKEGLGGIMFWELTLDKATGGLLDVIDGTLRSGSIH